MNIMNSYVAPVHTCMTERPTVWNFLLIFLVLITQVSCSSTSSEFTSLEAHDPHGVPFEEGKTWIKGPMIKGQERGDWYLLRARAGSGHIHFYQLCVRDRRSGEEGWAFYENTVDQKGNIHPTVVQERVVKPGVVINETVGIMFDRSTLDSAPHDGLALAITGQNNEINIQIDPAYFRGFLSLVDDYQDQDQKP